MRLKVSLDDTDELSREGKEMGAFLSDLKTVDQLSDAKPKRIRGIASMYPPEWFSPGPAARAGQHGAAERRPEQPHGGRPPDEWDEFPWLQWPRIGY
jgi:hypothetical protein